MLKNMKNSLVAALRVTPTNVNGDKKKMSPTDVLNTHWDFAEQLLKPRFIMCYAEK